MAIIIVIFLLAVILCKILKDKAGEYEYTAKKREYDTLSSDFEAAYTSKQLEDAITAAFDDKDKVKSIHQEVDSAFQQMKSWNGVRLLLNTTEFSYRGKPSKNKFAEQEKQMFEDRKVAMDIMLANRGKVSIDAARLGYKSYVQFSYNSTVQNLKERQYELVSWIRDTLKEQSVELTPVYVEDVARRVYGWQGSRIAPLRQWGTVSCHEFTHSLIEPPDIGVL